MILNNAPLTIDQQDLLQKIRHSQGPANQLTSDTQSPLSNKHPKIFVKKRHDFKAAAKRTSYTDLEKAAMGAVEPKHKKMNSMKNTTRTGSADS